MTQATASIPPDIGSDETTSLLKRYADHADRAAFDRLVRGHIDFVYAAARREIGGDSHAAEDVTQAVFVLLAKKAGRVAPNRLCGWLLLTTRYAAANAGKLAARRAYHERRAAAAKAETSMPVDAIEPDPMLPLLNDALASLGSADREVIAQRYLQGRDMSVVCTSLGVNAETGRKRVTRAVERLRKFFGAKGVIPATAGIAPVVEAMKIAAAIKAPVGLAAAASASALAAGAGAASIASIVKGATIMMTWVKVKLIAVSIVAGVLLAGASAEVIRETISSQPTPAPAGPGAEFVITSQSGVRIELLGLSQAKSHGKPWWRPDGSPLATPPYDHNGATMNPDANEVARDVAFKLTNPPQGSVSFRWGLHPSGSWAGGGAYDAQDHFLPGITGFAASIPKNQPTILHVDLADGPWQKRAENGINGGSSSDQGLAKGIIFSRPTDENGSATIIVSDTYGDLDSRIVAVGTDDQGHVMSSSGGSAGGMRQITARAAGLPLARVKRFEFQTRAFEHWVEFRNISINAGVKTKVEIVTDDDAPAPIKGTLRTGQTVELLAVAVNPSKGTNWWKPDGSPAAAPYPYVNNIMGHPPSYTSYELVLRFSNPADGSIAAWQADDFLYDGVAPVDRANKPITDLRAKIVTVPADQQITSLRTAILADNDWTTATTLAAGKEYTVDVPPIGSIQIGALGNRGNDATVTIDRPAPTKNTAAALRLWIIDTQGLPVAPTNEDSATGDRKMSAVLHFPRRAEQVKSYRLETRPLAGWVEFQNVSLRPGVVTNVQVMTSDDTGFGAEIQQTISITGRQKRLLDLDSGKLIDLPTDAVERNGVIQNIDAVAQNTGADIVGIKPPPLTGKAANAANLRKIGVAILMYSNDSAHVLPPVDMTNIRFTQMIYAPLPGNDWSKMDAAMIGRAIAAGPASPAAPPPDVGRFWAFRTRDGAVGKLEVLGLRPDGNGYGLRYCLISEPQSQTPAK